MVRAVTNCDPGGLYAPDNICTKTGRWVLDVLRENHPDAHIPKECAFDSYANSAELLEVMPIACYEEQISLRAAHLSGGAGTCGVDGTTLKEWLLRHEVSSERLREEIAHWVVWLSNDSPHFAAYRAVNLAECWRRVWDGKSVVMRFMRSVTEDVTCE